MKKYKAEDIKYLLKLYNLVSDYLSNNRNNEVTLSEIILSFCIVSEKVFKIILYKKNPILVFNYLKLKDDDAMVSIVRKIDNNIETIAASEAINRYSIIFKNKFSDEEIQAFRDIYGIRNNLIHGYNLDNKILSDDENILKKMGTVWGKISEEMVNLFGDNIIKASKPNKKYTESELEAVLTEEVRKKITQPVKDSSNTVGYIDGSFKFVDASSMFYFDETPITSGPNGLPNNRCPRCGNLSFSPEDSALGAAPLFNFSRKVSDLYRCKKCNLELTRKEYEIARKIQSF